MLQKSLVTRLKICLLLVAKVVHCKKLLVSRYENNPGTNIYLKAIKTDEFYSFIIYLHLTKGEEDLHTNKSSSNINLVQKSTT